MSAIVELRGVHVRFPQPGGRLLHASRDVSLAVGKGEIVTVVGESGCGKSTVGRLALGVLRPTEGTVTYQGRDIWAPGYRMDRATRLNVQVVHQDSYASLNPVKTVAQTLAAPLRVHHLERSVGGVEARVAALLEQVGLTPAGYFANKYPFQLSGGQRQRVSIARATLLEPRLIVADEPVSGVDASLRLAILDLMKDLNRRKGLAFLYITHDLATARYIGAGGRLVVMYLGQIVEEGEVGAVIDAPRHPYLQALLAALPPLDPRQARVRRPLPLRSLDLPDATDPPRGCAFHPRCPLAKAICEGQAPPVAEVGGGHTVRCHFAQP